MQLVSSKSNIWVRSYTRFTSAYQNRFLGSTSNDHNSLYRTNWVAYFIWNEIPLNYPSNDTNFTQIRYRRKELWSIYFSLSKQSTKGQIWHYLNFKGTLVIPYDIMDGNMCTYTCIWVQKLIFIINHWGRTNPSQIWPLNYFWFNRRNSKVIR